MNEFETKLKEMEVGETIYHENIFILRVPSGWIYSFAELSNANGQPGGNVYVPDTAEWLNGDAIEDAIRNVLNSYSSLAGG